MPAGAETAALRAHSAGDSAGTAEGRGLFAGLMSHFGGAPPGRDGMFVLPDGAGLPEGGQMLPPGLPFAAGDEAALFGLPADHAGLPPQARAALVLALRDPAGALPVHETGGRAAVIQAPLAPGLTVALADEAWRADAARQAAGLLALSPEILTQRMETAGQASVMNVTQPQLLPGAPQARRLESAALMSQSGVLAGLLNAVEAADAEMAPLAPMLSATPSAMTQGTERALPGWTLATPLHQAQQWGDEVGQRIRWMVGNQVHAAELRINPPQLGPIEVRVSVHNDQMNVSFLSQNGLVRDALEDALPRLRDMLSQQGYASVNVDVSEHPASHGGRDDDGREASAGDASAVPRNDAADGARGAVYLSSASSGFIDCYA